MIPRLTLLLALCCTLAGCLAPSGGGGSTPPADARREVPDPLVPVDPAVEPLTVAELQTLTLTGSGETLSFTATRTIDTRCYGEFNVLSISELSGVVTVDVERDADLWFTINHADCMIVPTLPYRLVSAAICQPIYFDPEIHASFIRYTISRDERGDISVTRELRTRVFNYFCSPGSNPAYQPHAQTGTMDTETYND